MIAKDIYEKIIHTIQTIHINQLPISKFKSLNHKAKVFQKRLIRVKLIGDEKNISDKNYK